MSVSSYGDLREHVGHKFECVWYGLNKENVSLECLTCNEVIIDYDKPKDENAGESHD